MKILIYTDPHLCTNASIVVGKMSNQALDRYSARLDVCISTFKWINEIASDNKVDKIVCLGDLTDQSKLSAEELSAISESNISSHEIVVGNHDISSADGYFNSCNIYNKAIRVPYISKFDNFNIVYLPYSREPIDLYELCKDLDPEQTYILSHNDIKGIRYGKYLSTSGYEPKDIMKVCKLFINGHLHVGSWVVKNRVMNLGTSTGLNFNNVGGWDPYIMILDTKTSKISWFENPYAFIFRDVKITSRLGIASFIKSLDKSRNNVVQLRVPKSMVEMTRDAIDNEESIKFSRVLTLHLDESEVEEETNLPEAESIESSINIYESLRNFVKSNCPNKYNMDEILKEVNLMESNS